MHANHFRRLALAQGLLPSQRAPAPERDEPPGAVTDDGIRSSGAPTAERTPESLH